MDDLSTRNGRRATSHDPTASVDHADDMLLAPPPPEIVEFARATDPYTNMLPGISNIRAARVISEGVQVGRRGRPVLMIVSLCLLATLLLPLLLAIVSQVSR